jgi:hypothetical protein
MRHPFQTYMFHMRYACKTCRFEIVYFWTASECQRECDYDETTDSDPVKISAA